MLACFIVRPVAFKYRSRRDAPRWRSRWDRALFVSGAAPALLFGVAVGNLIQGAPFCFTKDLHTIREGVRHTKFIGLLDLFSLLAGVVSLTMLITRGAAWLSVKTRARAIGSVTALLAVAGYILAGILAGLRD